MSWAWLDDVLPDAVVVMDERQAITVFNAAAERLWGYQACEVLGRPLSVLLPERFSQAHDAHAHAYAAGGEHARRMDRRAGVVARRRDGAEIPCEVSIARRVLGGRAEFVAIVRDLSDQQRVQRVARLGSWDWDVEADRLWWSTEALQLLGLTERPEVVRTTDFLERVHPADRERVRAAARATFEAHAPWDLEHRIVRPDGSVREVHQVGDASRDDRGRVVRLVGIVLDVTAARDVERGLAQSEATLRTLFASSREAMVLLDGAAGVRAFNDAAAALARQGGQPLEAGARLGAAFGGAGTSELLERAFSGEYAQLETQLGSSPPRWLELSASPVRLPGGSLAGLILIGRDVTERRHADLQLRQAQKMDTVGQLAGGIAHDFNNLLTVIIGGAGSLRDELAAGSPLLTFVEDIEEASARAAALTRQLLSFARLQPWAPSVVDVGAVVTEVERVLRRVIGSHVALRVDAAPACYVRIDPTQLEQVLMNLAVNARDAMPAGGTISISVTRSPPLDAPGTEDQPREVRLRVTDTGAGIAPAIRERLFEPFFTTKAPGKGTGLGLATCHGIVSQAHGRIELTSAAGEGACFTLHFPLAAPPETARRGAEVRASPGGKELVLVAEDEPRVRRLVTRALEGAGYGVVAAGSGVEALEALEALDEGRNVSLIITDVMMPKLSGPGLASAARARQAALPVLFVTAYPDNARLELADDRIELLLKPFTAQELLARVRRLLDAQLKRP